MADKRFFQVFCVCEERRFNVTLWRVELIQEGDKPTQMMGKCSMHFDGEPGLVPGDRVELTLTKVE